MLCFLVVFVKKGKRKTATTSSTRISFTQGITATPKLSSKLKIIIKEIRKK